MIDIHSHIAWQIDDGMPCQEDAMKAFEMAKEDGIQMICSTPHFVSGQLTKESIELMKNRQRETQALGRQYGIDVVLGSEMFMNEQFPICLKNSLYATLNESRYLLCEFDVRKDIHRIDGFDEYLYEITAHGMIPVIAHVERYFLNGLDMDIINDWKDKGYLFQVNTTSLDGLHGKTIQKNAWKLVKMGYVHVIASDAHRAQGSRIEKMSSIYSILEKNFGKEFAELLLHTNPLHILRDEEVMEMKPKKKGFFWRK